MIDRTKLLQKFRAARHAERLERGLHSRLHAVQQSSREFFRAEERLSRRQQRPAAGFLQLIDHDAQQALSLGRIHDVVDIVADQDLDADDRPLCRIVRRGPRFDRKGFVQLADKVQAFEVFQQAFPRRQAEADVVFRLGRQRACDLSREMRLTAPRLAAHHDEIGRRHAVREMLRRGLVRHLILAQHHIRMAFARQC